MDGSELFRTENPGTTLGQLSKFTSAMYCPFGVKPSF